MNRFPEINSTEIINGEHLLLGGTPPGWPGPSVKPAFFYKRRYTWDGDIILGCTIGCSFCYYRWINNTYMNFGRGKEGLRRIGEPEEAVKFLEQSRLFAPKRDIIMLCARSDGSMQISEITRFLHAFKHSNWIFVLHRAPFSPRELEEWGKDDRVVYCTTITPKPPESGPFSWTPIRAEDQIEGIRFLIKNGIPHKRISLMLGPFNTNNVDAGVKLIKILGEMGFKFATYRGCSIGNFGVAPDRDRLRQEGFLDGFQDESSAPEGHDYYKMKNWLAPEVEEKLLQAGKEAGMRLYRFTGELYKNEYGVPIAYNRHNHWRRELGQWKKIEIKPLFEYLRWLGYHPISIQETEEGYFVELPENEVATEDVAMTVGAEFETSVLFNNYRIAPSLSDLRFYAQNRLFWPLPEGWDKVVDFYTSRTYS